MNKCPRCEKEYDPSYDFCEVCENRKLCKNIFEYKQQRKRELNLAEIKKSILENMDKTQVSENAKSSEFTSLPTYKVDARQPPQVSCPKCGCTQISANQRGWKITTGFIGSSKVINTCMNCGYEWKPGKR